MISDQYGIDFVEELRLRRWARENYVSAERRNEAWHPIVRAEMRSIDAERQEQASPRPGVPRYVPLPPTEFVLVDAAHAQPGEPNLLRAAPRVDASAVEMLYN